ncbi:15604_t:CDS:1, partial [Cetraspora pellucida]
MRCILEPADEHLNYQDNVAIELISDNSELEQLSNNAYIQQLSESNYKLMQKFCAKINKLKHKFCP